jgi:hypothetical protein
VRVSPGSGGPRSAVATLSTPPVSERFFTLCAGRVRSRPWGGAMGRCAEAADVDHRQVVGCRLDRVAVVMHLHELGLTGRRASLRRERWRLERLAKMREDLPDRRRVDDEGAEADVAATSGAREREVFGDPSDELGLSRREVSWERGCSWLRAPSPRPSPKGRGSGSGERRHGPLPAGAGAGARARSDRRLAMSLSGSASVSAWSGPAAARPVAGP